MTVELRAIKLGCLCGAARTEINLPLSTTPVTAAFCHCNSCRHMSGCLAVTSIPFSTEDNYKPPNDLLEKLTEYEFCKDQIYHYFCSACGTHILAHVLPRDQNGFKGSWYAMCGVIEDVEDLYHPRHEYIADTIDGGCSDFLVSMNGKAIERWSQHPSRSDQLPLYWKSEEVPRGDRLHAYCKCKGVEFWIRRPICGNKFPAFLCACDSCRSSRGMEWFAGGMALIPISQVSLDPDGPSMLDLSLSFGTLRTYQSSPTIKRTFCDTCGATVFVHMKGMVMFSVAVGLLDAPEGARAESWLKWNLKNIPFREDSILRAKSLTEAAGEGIRWFQSRV